MIGRLLDFSFGATKTIRVLCGGWDNVASRRVLDTLILDAALPEDTIAYIVRTRERQLPRRTQCESIWQPFQSS
jgi:hypothetical protein